VQETQKVKKPYREVSAGLTWQAVYSDRVLNQYNEDGFQNSYGGLDRNGLTAFNLVDGKGNVVVTVPLDSSKKLFYRMRVALFVYSRVRERVYIVGWQSADDVRIWVVDSAGKVKTHKSWREKSQWLYAPQFYPSEMV
jgi:hypothetical protein